MSLREAVRQPKSLRTLRALVATTDTTILLAIGAAGALAVAATVFTRLAVDRRMAFALVTVLAATATATSYGWYFGRVASRVHRPSRSAPAPEFPREDTLDGRRFDHARRTPAREHAILDNRRPDANGRIHRQVHLGRGPNRTVGHRFGQDSS